MSNLMFYMLLQSIPLFHALFKGSSIHFRSERLWILQLLYAGLNLHDDAKIYKKNSILEHLLNFYSSSASDPDSRFLILEVNFTVCCLPYNLKNYR